jgi:formate-dependent nitrite reductase membrane component NrfD
MSNTSAVTPDGLRDGRPAREAMTGVNVDAPSGGRPAGSPAGPSRNPASGPRRRRRHEQPEFRSYYDLPVINKPVWESPDIPGYLFLGGMAGSSALIAACADLSGRPTLARVGKVGAALGSQLSLVALIHDLGRSGRFLNMMRMFKVTSPMSVGSWLLAGFTPAAAVAAGCDVLGVLAPVDALATACAAALGAPVATYTAALISNTAVPAWHDGHRWMPFIFASSALSAGAALGLLAAPDRETDPLVPLAVIGSVGELALEKVMEKRIGIVEEAYHEGKAGRYMKLAEAMTLAGAGLAAVSRRRRPRKLLAGALLLAGSAVTRFGIFEAGIASAEDPKYTVVPQRERLRERDADV